MGVQAGHVAALDPGTVCPGVHHLRVEGRRIRSPPSTWAPRVTHAAPRSHFLWLSGTGENSHDLLVLHGEQEGNETVVIKYGKEDFL